MANEIFKQPFSVVLDGGEEWKLEHVRQIECVQSPFCEDEAGIVVFIQRLAEPTDEPMEGYFLMRTDGQEQFQDWSIISDYRAGLLRFQSDIKAGKEPTYSLVHTYAGAYLAFVKK